MSFEGSTDNTPFLTPDVPEQTPRTPSIEPQQSPATMSTRSFPTPDPIFRCLQDPGMGRIAQAIGGRFHPINMIGNGSHAWMIDGRLYIGWRQFAPGHFDWDFLWIELREPFTLIAAVPTGHYRLNSTARNGRMQVFDSESNAFHLVTPDLPSFSGIMIIEDEEEEGGWIIWYFPRVVPNTPQLSRPARVAR